VIALSLDELTPTWITKYSENDSRKDTMQLDTFQFSGPVRSRRQIIRSLAAATFTLSIAGCASTGSSLTARPSPTTPPAQGPGKTLYLYQGHTDQVLATAWSPDSKRIASGSRDETVQVWDALTGAHAFTYREHSATVAALSWSPDGQLLASGAWDQTVQIWNSTSGTLRLTYHKHTADLTTVAWSPDGKYIASGSADKTVQVWEAQTGALTQNYRGHTGGVTTAVWSPDGKYIASGSADKTVQVWEGTTGKLLQSFLKHTSRVTAIAWSPDGKYIASGSSDKTVQVWEAATGQILYIYNGYNAVEAHQNPTKGVPPDLIYAVGWSHNGKWIAAVTQIYCGDDCGEVVIWDALTKEHLTFYPTQPMYTLAISPNDKYFASSIGLSQVQVALAP
jgi:WD40 repeat protein